MTRVANFSRHEFNRDQLDALQAAGYEPDEEGARSPFFTSLADFVEKCGGRVVSAVVPGDIIRDAWAAQDDPSCIPAGTVMIGWRTDNDARKRGRFAVRGITIHEWCELGGLVMPELVYSAKLYPSVENEFRSGEEFDYGGS